MPFHCARGAFSKNEEPTGERSVEEAEVRGLAAEVRRRLLGLLMHKDRRSACRSPFLKVLAHTKP